MSPQDFPLLRSLQHNTEKLDAAIEKVESALASSSIRNSEFQDLKRDLSRAVTAGWRAYIGDMYTNQFQSRCLSSEIRDLYWSVTVTCLHHVIASSKRIKNSFLQGELVDAMRKFFVEVLPLAEAVESLKTNVIKGRAPSASPAKVGNPKKIVKTCPVCLRGIAVQGGTMVHHGYQRPEQGLQTQSCPGIRFRPLEVSTEGMEWLIGVLQNSLAAAKGAPEQKHQFESLEREIAHKQKFLELAKALQAQNA